MNKPEKLKEASKVLVTLMNLSLDMSVIGSMFDAYLFTNEFDLSDPEKFYEEVNRKDLSEKIALDIIGEFVKSLNP